MPTLSAYRNARALGRKGFTLIELLAVVAIIVLLMGILLPSLHKSRELAKKVKTQAQMKAIGDGLVAFGGENPDELQGNDYPSSAAINDPTVSGTSALDMFGAQRAVRYLLGKDMRGYVAHKSVPKSAACWPGWPNDKTHYQEFWYPDPNSTPPACVPAGGYPRSGPYLSPEGVRLKATTELGRGVIKTGSVPVLPNLVFVDTFDMPILYYAANSRLARQPSSALATHHYSPAYPGDSYPGIFSFSDNAMFTGGQACDEDTGLCSDFAGYDFADGRQLENNALLLTPPPTTKAEQDTLAKWQNFLSGNPHSFANYILNKDVYNSTNHNSIVPARKESFLLISPGKDGKFGTPDDIKNF
jgi:prepilin-type N-terminal cleavage/methylation domain-containing protein